MTDSLGTDPHGGLSHGRLETLSLVIVSPSIDLFICEKIQKFKKGKLDRFLGIVKYSKFFKNAMYVRFVNLPKRANFPGF